MASITKRKSKYSVVYDYYDEEGVRHQKWETWGTYSEAKRRKAEIEHKQTNNFVSPIDFLSTKPGRKERISITQINIFIPPLLDMVDDKRIAFNPAVELSYLPIELQTELYDVIEAEECTPSLSQAQRMHCNWYLHITI